MIEEIVQTILRSHKTSSGDNLLGMILDMKHFLGLCDGLSVTSLKVTEYPASLLDIEMHATEEATSKRDLTIKLEQVWSCCQYRYLQCYSIESTDECLTLRFVTVISADSFCVTGVFRILGTRWSELPDFE